MFLAIDTSTDNAGIAISDGQKILAQRNWYCHQNQTVELLPNIANLLAEKGLSLNAVKAVIIARGPGSYNGLRVGLSTAKGLSFSLDIAVIGISTLAAEACRYIDMGLPICPIFNAGRQQIATAIYHPQNGGLKCLIAEEVTTPAELAAKINEPTLFCGQYLPQTVDEIIALLGDKAILATEEAVNSRVSCLVALGVARFNGGDTDNPATLQPLYLRKPAITTPRKARGITKREAGAVIWDMDGVIVDSAPAHLKAWRQVFGERGIAFSERDFTISFGRRNDAIIDSVLGINTTQTEIKAIGREKEAAFRRIVVKDLIALPGVTDLMEALRDGGYQMAIASSTPLENITLIMRELGLSSYCKVIISEQDAEHGKPDPQCFLLAAHKLSVKPADSIVIEDTTSGLEAAAQAGMSSIAVTNTHPAERLKEADIVTASLKTISLNDIEKLIDRRREMEKTLVLIKPDAVARGLNGAIITRLEEGGLKLVALKMLQMDKTLAEKHYAPHKDKPFFKSLVGYITSGPITAAVFSGENSVEKGRLMMGATDPKNSEKGTIRGDFGLDIERNTIHGSDAPETAEREIALFFKSDELVDYQRE